MTNSSGGPLEVYESLAGGYGKDLEQLHRRSGLLSGWRLLSILVFIVSLFYVSGNLSVALPVAIISFTGFVLFVRYHAATERDIKLKSVLLKINEDEISCLKGQVPPFEDGIEFNSVSHPYANDLDVFGQSSLFQYMNRTGTYPGKKQLADTLLNLLPDAAIISNQEAIRELAQKIEWRQHLYAMATLSRDNKASYERLINWCRAEEKSPGAALRFFSFFLPVLTVSCILLYYFDVHRYFLPASAALFVTNLTILMTQYAGIRKVLFESGNIHDTVRQYSRIIFEIEHAEFESGRLRELKSGLQVPGGTVSRQVKEFSSIFNDLSTINKSIGAFIMNGLFMRHLHVLHKLYVWKSRYAAFIPAWLGVVGGFETLNSIAGFAYNNPGFIYPELNRARRIDFQELGHPLIGRSQRVNNTVVFENGRFIILTGSNMSGKSTFLRTLGINMVLTGMGAPVCAAAASVHPMKVIVAMRLNDSLSSGESYFLAEVKRLRQIMDALGPEGGFVLLDEILRGTNSDDKRAGTVAVIRKMLEKGAVGVIATHDIEVCQIADEYPQLENMCFEVETEDGELRFDYKLRSGVCRNRSASMLLKKMEII